MYKAPTGHVLFVDELNLQGNLKQGALQAMALEDPKLGKILTAREGTMANGIYTIKDGIYSPCPKCEHGSRAWQVKADRVQVNPANNTVTYNNAVLEAHDLPVFYLPYFQHPLRTDVAQSGLLPPKFGHSTNLGDEIEQGYYYINEEDNVDYTGRIRAMSSRGIMGRLERRHEGINTSSEFRTSFIQDSRRDTFRSHIDAEIEYTLQPGRRIGLNGEVASDDTYLNDFFGETENYLPTTAYLEDASRNHYFGAFGTWYQDLDINRDPAQTAHQLPHIQFEKVWDLPEDFGQGGQFILDADALALHRSTGVRSRRLVSTGRVIQPWQLPGGNLITFQGDARVDFYNVDSFNEGDDTVRSFGQVALEWERPMLSPNAQHLLTPRIMAIYAPRGGNPEDIPNEDSQAYELDHVNLFSPNRFAGYDRLENGPRLVYGLDNSFGDQSNPWMRLFFGQNWRRFDDAALPTGAGTATKLSDWVGYIEIDPATWFHIDNAFRLDNADFNARRLDTSLRLGEHEEGPLLLMTHTMLDGGPEELKLEGRLPLSQDWELTAETQRDIADKGRQLYGEVALTYTSDCYRLTFLTRRRGFTTADVQPSTDYLVNLQLLTLGRDYE